LDLNWGTQPTSLLSAVSSITASFDPIQAKKPKLYKGTVTTVIGNNKSGFADGEGYDAKFNFPWELVLDSEGNIFLVDRSNHKIRKISKQGIASTIAGSVKGYAEGVGSRAMFHNPAGIALDNEGNLYVADCFNHRIRKITQSGSSSTVAGRGSAGFFDGPTVHALFRYPWGIAIDAEGSIYVADTNNHRIRKIEQGNVTTFAGSGIAGYADGMKGQAMFNQPYGIAVDEDGNVFVADYSNHCIRKVTQQGDVSTMAGNGKPGYADAEGNQALFNYPMRLALDAGGNLFVTDYCNHKIRKVTQQGVVTTIAGSGIAGFSDGTGSRAMFNNPSGIALDSKSNIFVADSSNHKIRQIV